MNICNLDIDHFNLLNLIEKTPLRSLKNLPTTWGLRQFDDAELQEKLETLKNLPTTWGLRLKVGELKKSIKL